MNARIASLSAVALLATSGSAWADDADRCASLAERAQRDRLAGRVRAAREGLIACSSETCPRAVRSDCGRWLSEVESELPTVVVRAVDGRGHDLTDVRVMVDGELLSARADGRPLPVDIGERTFRFERDGAASVTARIVVRSGERNRVVSATFASTEASAAPRSAAPFVLGALGLALATTGVVLWATGKSEHGDLESTCAPSGGCATADVDAAKTKLVVGDVMMLGGVLAIAGAVTWYLLASPSATSAASSRPRFDGPWRF